MNAYRLQSPLKSARPIWKLMKQTVKFNVINDVFISTGLLSLYVSFQHIILKQFIFFDVLHNHNARMFPSFFSIEPHVYKLRFIICGKKNDIIICFKSVWGGGGAAGLFKLVASSNLFNFIPDRYLIVIK